MPLFAQTSVTGPAEMTILLVFLAAFGAFFAVSFIPWVFYLLTLQKALSRCSAENRTLSPDLVWLLLIPVFNLVWMFIVVTNVSTSLGNEFRRRGVAESPNPAQGVGLAMAICNILVASPLVGCLASVPSFVCWIIHWVKIVQYSSRIGGLAPTEYAYRL